MAEDHLTKLRISVDGFLKLKTDVAPHLAKNDALGADGLWSADMLHRHLQHLEGLVPRTASFNHSHIIARYKLTTRSSLQNEAAARLWISAFFYRVASMTPNGTKVVLSVAQGIPSAILSDESPPVSGYIHHWAAIATSPQKAGASVAFVSYLSTPPQLFAALFLVKARVGDLRSEDSTLFISKAKGPNQLLESHVPQAICEMYACARTVG